MSIQVNDVYEPVTEDAIISAFSRVLWVGHNEGVIAFIDISSNLEKQPFLVGFDEFKKSVKSGDVKLAKIKVPQYILVLDEELSPEQKQDRDKKWEMIAPIVNHEIPGYVFFPGELEALVAARALALGVYRKKIFRLLHRYWVNGQVRNSLLKDYSRVGKTTRIFVAGKKPGRKTTYQGELVTQHKMLEPVDFKCIRAGYALFVDDETASRRAAYDKMLSIFYKVKDLSKHPESLGKLLPTSEIPSYRQFMRHGKKFFDETTTARGRMGERKWQKDGRGLEGTVRDNLRGPCHQFEIDSTVADIYLVNSYSRHMLIGRPIIYVVIDSYSGMIVGLYVGLEGPSWNGARQALFNAFTPKQNFCALNGVNISEDDWPCHHLPYEVFADRAEMLSEGAEGLASGLGVDIGIAPPFRPDWKSMVESRFNILNSLSGIRWMPGGVAARNRERGERDYRLDATMNMREFTKTIIKCVLHYNQFNRQPARLSKQMIDDQVEPTPIAIWNWAIENDFMRDNNQSEELVYLNLLPRDTGSVRKGGVLFRGMHYVSEYLTHNNWTAIARNQGSWPIECWHLHEAANHIWIQDSNKQFVRCDLRKSDQKYADYRSDEVYDMLEAYRQVPPSHARAELESRVALLDDFEGTFNTAALEKKQTPAPKSKAQATGNIREQRSEELARERASAPIPDGVLPAKSAVQEPTKTDHAHHFAGARGAVIIDMLKRIRPGNKP